MWDLQTALQATAVVAVVALIVPPLARGVGGICAVIGFFGVVQSSSWAPTVAALGLLGSWGIGPSRCGTMCITGLGWLSW